MAEWLGAVTKAFKIDPRRDSTNSRVFLRQSLIDKGYGKFDSTSEYQLTSDFQQGPSAGISQEGYTLSHLTVEHSTMYNHIHSLKRLAGW